MTDAALAALDAFLTRGRRAQQAVDRVVGGLGFTCACGETRPEQFRASEPRRCKPCRRAYNAARKRALR